MIGSVEETSRERVGRGVAEKEGPDGQVAMEQERELQAKQEAVTSHSRLLSDFHISRQCPYSQHKQARRGDSPCANLHREISNASLSLPPPTTGLQGK